MPSSLVLAIIISSPFSINGKFGISIPKVSVRLVCPFVNRPEFALLKLNKKVIICLILWLLYLSAAIFREKVHVPTASIFIFGISIPKIIYFC